MKLSIAKKMVNDLNKCDITNGTYNEIDWLIKHFRNKKIDYNIEHITLNTITIQIYR